MVSPKSRAFERHVARSPFVFSCFFADEKGGRGWRRRVDPHYRYHRGEGRRLVLVSGQQVHWCCCCRLPVPEKGGHEISFSGTGAVVSFGK